MSFKIGDIVRCSEPDPFNKIGKIYDIEIFDYDSNFYNILIVFDEYVYVNGKKDTDWLDSYVWTNDTYLSHVSSLERELF